MMPAGQTGPSNLKSDFARDSVAATPGFSRQLAPVLAVAKVLIADSRTMKSRKPSGTA
jgi:hypothetical protein